MTNRNRRQPLRSPLTIDHFNQGSQVYATENKAAVAGFPKSMEQVFPGVPSGVTAAFTKRGLLYFVVTDKFYRATMYSRGRASTAIKVPCPFTNCPKRVEAAFEWPNYAIFFFNNNHYQTAYQGSKVRVCLVYVVYIN